MLYITAGVKATAPLFLGSLAGQQCSTRSPSGLHQLINGALGWCVAVCNRLLSCAQLNRKAQRLMKTAAHLLTLLTIIALVACSSAPEPAPQPTAPAPTAAPPAAAPVEVAPKGNSITVGKSGVEVNTNNAAVKVSPDSATIVLPRKK